MPLVLLPLWSLPAALLCIHSTAEAIFLARAHVVAGHFMTILMVVLWDGCKQDRNIITSRATSAQGKTNVFPRGPHFLNAFELRKEKAKNNMQACLVGNNHHQNNND
jgi:hypothetical protein